ncbi:MAG: cupin domain-containing protein [Rhodocyclaceae bacterium]
MSAKHCIIRADDMDAMPEQRLSHPLDEQAVRHTRSLGDATGLTRVGVHVVRVPPGGLTTVKHRHAFVDEFIYILEGEASVELDAASHVVRAGDFIGLPAHGPAHAMRNTGTGELRYLVGGTRPEFDVCDYPDKGCRLYLSVHGAQRHRDFVATDDVDRR